MGWVVFCGCVGCEQMGAAALSHSGAACGLHALHCWGCCSTAAGVLGVPGVLLCGCTCSTHY